MKPEYAAKLIQFKPGEDILAIMHQSVIPHTPKFVLIFLWFLVPFFFLFPLFRAGFPGILIFLALFLSSLVLWLRSYRRWFRTVVIVTDRRLIDLDQRGLFDCVVTEAPFAQVDEVTYRVKGIFPTVCRYGDVRVQLSGSAADLSFSRIPTPQRLHDLINDLRVNPPTTARDPHEETLRRLAKRATPDEIHGFETTLRDRETDEGLEELYEKS